MANIDFQTLLCVNTAKNQIVANKWHFWCDHDLVFWDF